MSLHPTQAKALDAESFAANLGRLLKNTPRGLGLAVSGGPDSMALALCAQRWGQAVGCAVKAFIVDHRLRPESEAEAETVKARLAALGVPAEILVWHHGPVPTKIHVAAREARYALLAEACRAEGIQDLLIAHQAEDQAETILMRFAKGSGVTGLAGIPPITMREGIRLLRPLLSVPRARLIATCHQAGVAFVTDPSNVKDCYARGRLRKIQPLLEAEGFTMERLLDLGERARDADAALAEACDRFLENTGPDAYGVIRLPNGKPPGSFQALPREIALRVLAACLQTIAPAPFGPKRAAVKALYTALLDPTPFRAMTLHGTLVTRKESQITLFRESGLIPPCTPIAPDEPLIWDGRWRVVLQQTPEGLKLSATQAMIGANRPPITAPSEDYTLRPLGLQPKDLLNKLAPFLRKACPEGRARAALPGLFWGETLVAIPDFVER